MVNVLRHPVQLSINRNKMPLCTYFNRIVCLYLAKMYECSFGHKEMSRVPKYGNFFFETPCTIVKNETSDYIMVDNECLGAKN